MAIRGTTLFSTRRADKVEGAMVRKAQVYKEKVSAAVELLLWLIFVAVGLWHLGRMPEVHMFAGFDPTWWPQGVLILVLIVAVAQFLARMRNASLAQAQPSAGEPIDQPSPSRVWENVNARTIATFLVPVLYIILMPRMGFVISTPLFFAIYLYVLGERRPRLIAGLAVAVPAVFITLFLRIFYIDLPIGSWPGFYEFGDWFLRMLL
jgi:cell division protein FtsW (lipid II flippase)